MKQIYEERAGNSGDSRLIKDLEDELEKTKSYYNKRIREIEDKYKYGMGKSKASNSDLPKSHRSQASNAETNSELKTLRDQNERLLKERNHLATKVGELEQQKINSR